MLSRRGFLAAASAAPWPLRAADDFARLLERFAQPVEGRLGFAMRHLESGETLSLRGGERFPMASVYKLPIAAALLHQADQEVLRLEDVVRLGPESLRLGLGNREVEQAVLAGRRDFPVSELLERMLVDSDNASSDALLDLVGAKTVTARLRAWGVDGVRVDRPEYALLLDFAGVSSEPPPEGWSLDRLRQRYRSAGPAERRLGMARFLADPRDTATPDSMVDLLVKIHRRELLRPASGDRLVRLLERCETGANRLRGDLPADVVFAHRTGTTDTTDGVAAGTNDVGVLTLPDGLGHVALAAFLKQAKGETADRERVLSRIGRAVFERYVGA